MYVHVYHTVMAHATPPPCSVKYDSSVIILLIIIFDSARTIIVIMYPYHQPLPSRNMLLVFKFSRKILNFNPPERTGEHAGPLFLSSAHSPDRPSLPAAYEPENTHLRSVRKSCCHTPPPPIACFKRQTRSVSERVIDIVENNIKCDANKSKSHEVTPERGH